MVAKKSNARKGVPEPKERNKPSTQTTKRKLVDTTSKERQHPEAVPAARPARTIHVQSWAAPIVGWAMLVIGFLAGFFLRPWILGQTSNATAAISTAPAGLQSTDQAVERQKLMESLIPNVRHFKGDPDSPVTIIEFADFQCPYCGQFAATTGAEIDEQYIRVGKVRWGYWNFAFLGAESNWAAEAAECAGDQNKFWEYHDTLYSSQSGENRGTFSRDRLKDFAEDLGLDTSTFNECFDSGKYIELIKNDSRTASALGLRSTPTFLINGQPLVGAQPFEKFEQAIASIVK